jgi:hypothetical protein
MESRHVLSPDRSAATTWSCLPSRRTVKPSSASAEEGQEGVTQRRCTLSGSSAVMLMRFAATLRRLRVEDCVVALRLQQHLAQTPEHAVRLQQLRALCSDLACRRELGSELGRRAMAAFGPEAVRASSARISRKRTFNTAVQRPYDAACKLVCRSRSAATAC